MKTLEFIEKVIEEEMDGCFRDCSWDHRDQLVGILEKYHQEQLRIYVVEQSQTEGALKTISVPDIRNKLSPLCHLIAVLEEGDYIEAVNSLKIVKESVNYLTDRKFYK